MCAIDHHAKTAAPPLHSVAFVGVMIAACLAALPSTESVDEVSTVDLFCALAHPNGIVSTPAILGWARLATSVVIFSVSAYLVVDGGWEQTTAYLSQSKIKAEPIKIYGLLTMAPFTSWAWNMLGISFLLNGSIPLLVAYGKEEWVMINSWYRRLALLSFETAAPFTVLVSAVIKYAIWPMCLKHGGSESASQLQRVTALMQHNANVLFALVEVGLLGRMPVKAAHFAVAPLFGCAYVLFTWSMTSRWTPGRGPQFIYFFMDTTLGRTSTVALIVLLLVLLLSYALFSIADYVLEHLEGGPLVSALAVAVTFSSVSRFRD